MEYYTFDKIGFWNKNSKETLGVEFINNLKVPDSVSLVVYNSEELSITILNSKELNNNSEFGFNNTLQTLKHHLDKDNLESDCNHTYRIKDKKYVWYNFIIR